MTPQDYKVLMHGLLEIQQVVATKIADLPNVWASSLGLEVGSICVYKLTNEPVVVKEFYVRHVSGQPELVAWTEFNNPVERSKPIPVTDLEPLPQPSCVVSGLQMEI